MKSKNRSIYERSRTTIRITFILVAMAIAIVSLFVSDRLIGKMANEERQKMELWAGAARTIANDDPRQTMALVFKIIESNSTIPVILCTEHDSIISYNNINLPEKGAEQYLRQKLAKFKNGYAPIPIEMGYGGTQYLYYSDSSTLRQLLLFPYIQLSAIFIFIFISMLAIMGTKRAEQNRLWEGLSKETAHQLGTPISSLMAWTEILRSGGADGSILSEIDKDTDRLKMIADRFQKIGSEPTTETREISTYLSAAVDYMRSRISRQVNVSLCLPAEPIYAKISTPLLSWVIENLLKNAVDAMQGKGVIEVKLKTKGKQVVIDVADSGRGIPKSKLRAVFRPGYTTRQRGWGLGLSLAKRIIEEYHRGRIFVLHSEVGVGTTFRIILNRTDEMPDYGSSEASRLPEHT